MPTLPAQARGFAGLNCLLSDPDTELRNAAAKAVMATTSSQGAAASQTAAAPQPVPLTAVPGDGKSSHAWVWRVILAGIGLIMLVSYLNKPNNLTYAPSTRSTSTSSSSPFTSSNQPIYTTTSNVQERVPAIGRGLALDEAEIRYCVAQKVRLEGARSMVDNTSSYDINRFNLLISDFNSRCSDYRYKPSAMNRVRLEVESRQGTLLAEGRLLMR